MQFKIKDSSNQWVDITSYIAYGGLKESRNSIDGPTAGRALSGLMYRDKVGDKMKFEITCRPLTTTEKNTIYTLTEPEYVNVQVADELTTKTYECYSGSIGASYLVRHNATEYYSGITFSLVER